MSEIRVTYSGLISFGIGLTTVITGLAFMLIVTRTLSPEQLGTWSLVGGLITYVTIIEPIISYWTTRNIARGIKAGRTSILSSTLFSVVGAIVFLFIAYAVSLGTDVDSDILFFATIMIPLIFLNRTLDAINLGWKPHLKAYGLLAFDISKIPAALVFIYFLDMGVKGAILAVSMGYIVTIIVLLILSRKNLKGKFNLKLLKKWLKLSWVPVYRKFGSLMVFDVLIFSTLTGSVFGLAYWTAAFSVSSLLRHTNLITRAVYPKLLSGGKREYLQQSLTTLLYFSLPFSAMSIVFAKPGLFALNPIYQVAVPIVIVLTLRAFITNLTHVFSVSLGGIEKVDMDDKSTFRDYISSNLFRVPTIRLIEHGVYIAVLLVGLSIALQITEDQLELVYYWSVIALGSQIPFTIYIYFLTRKQFTISLNFASIFKYLFSSVFVFGLTYVIMEKYLIYNESIFYFLPNLLLFVAISGAGYIGLTYLIDNKTRILVQSIINELRRKKLN